jgi:predicted thioredoxin/glutaredoxin
MVNVECCDQPLCIGCVVLRALSEREWCDQQKATRVRRSVISMWLLTTTARGRLGLSKLLKNAVTSAF